MARLQREYWRKYHRRDGSVTLAELLATGVGLFAFAVGVVLLAARLIGGVR